MALWDKIRSRGNIEDRRGVGPVAIGGLGASGIALLLLFNLLTGGDVSDVINQLPSTPSQNVQDADTYQGEDEYEVFASKVLGSANEMWRAVFSTNNLTYEEPMIVLFRSATNSLCGTATSQVGPHYCPYDQTIYLDETFFDELTNLLGAKGGDVAEAYVIAHEVGHHAQNELGILNIEKQKSNQESINIELQADCFAGMWAYSIRDEGVFLPNEIEEAMDAAASVGDDRIQQTTQGYTNSETWTHGSAQERLEWFTKGYEVGTLEACDTSS